MPWELIFITGDENHQSAGNPCVGQRSGGPRFYVGTFESFPPPPPHPFLFPKPSKRSCQALQRSSRPDLGCVCLEYKALPAFTIRKEPRESLRDHMGGIKVGPRGPSPQDLFTGFYGLSGSGGTSTKICASSSSHTLTLRPVGQTPSGVSRDVWALTGPLEDLHSCV